MVTVCEVLGWPPAHAAAGTARIVRRITTATAGFLNKMPYLLSPYRSGAVIAKTGYLVRSMLGYPESTPNILI